MRVIEYYVCPACRSPVLQQTGGYDCRDCGAHFPVLFGIADFRLRPDRYLSLQEERDKAQHLFEFGQQASLRELVAEYYRITDDVSPQMAARFSDYIFRGVQRGELVCDGLDISAGQTVLDAGCASGGLIVAAARRGGRVVGVDIALRWLVICAKRLEEEAAQADLICADVGALPFPPEQFSVCVGADLLEHVSDQAGAMSEMARVLVPGARVYVSGANRFTLAPYPSAGLWGVGFLPRRLRAAYIKSRRGLDTLRHVTLLSPRKACQLARQAKLEHIALSPLPIDTELARTRSWAGRLAIVVYSRMRVLPGLKYLLLMLGPVFQMQGRKAD